MGKGWREGTMRLGMRLQEHALLWVVYGARSISILDFAVEVNWVTDSPGRNARKDAVSHSDNVEDWTTFKFAFNFPIKYINTCRSDSAVTKKIYIHNK